MADSRDRYPDNVPGPYYVDSQCIDCDLCQRIAPETFGRNVRDGHAVVIKQPSTSAERAAAHEALEHCPVEAIGDGA